MGETVADCCTVSDKTLHVAFANDVAARFVHASVNVAVWRAISTAIGPRYPFKPQIVVGTTEAFAVVGARGGYILSWLLCSSEVDTAVGWECVCSRAGGRAHRFSNGL